MLSTDEIMARLPHRYPFLLVDRIVEVTYGQRAVGIKNVTVNEPFFQGHFPGKPIMPGVLIIEALAQVTGIAFMGENPEPGRLGLFASIGSFRWRRPVVPGDTLRLESVLTKVRSSIAKATVTATVDGQVVAEGEITLAVGRG